MRCIEEDEESHGTVNVFNLDYDDSRCSKLTKAVHTYVHKPVFCPLELRSMFPSSRRRPKYSRCRTMPLGKIESCFMN